LKKLGLWVGVCVLAFKGGLRSVHCWLMRSPYFFYLLTTSVLRINFNKTMAFKKVTKFTRAGKDGKEIICPKCSHKVKVSHFAWTAINCQGCKQEIQKTDFKIANPIKK
jgi:hypothetical protein